MNELAPTRTSHPGMSNERKKDWNPSDNIRIGPMKILMTLEKWVIISMLIVAIIPVVMLRQVEGQTVNIDVSQDFVTLNMDLVLKQNISISTFPIINSYVSLANSTSVTQQFVGAINAGIKSLVSTARVSNFELRIRTTTTSTAWQLDETFVLTITGANTNSGSNVRSNLGFIPMNINQSLKVGTAELNEIGLTYLLPALDAKAANYTNLQYFIDGSPTRTAVIPEQTTEQFRLLDFGWVTPISTWANNNTVFGRSSSWTFSPVGPRYNLTLGLPSPEGPLLASYVATYSPSMSLTAPANAWVSGNVVSFDVPAPAEALMPAIVAAAFIIVIVTLLLDRKLTGRVQTRKKR